jgi:hypothetical protein
MRIPALIGILLLAPLVGCSRAVEVSVDTTTPFITPEQRSRMPLEERDDPYTIMHTQQQRR